MPGQSEEDYLQTCRRSSDHTMNSKEVENYEDAPSDDVLEAADPLQPRGPTSRRGNTLRVTVILFLVLVVFLVAEGYRSYVEKVESPSNPVQVVDAKQLPPGDDFDNINQHLDGPKESASSKQTDAIKDGAKKPAHKAIVMASSEKYPEWLKELPSEWEVFDYVFNDPSIEDLTIPKNNGREAMVYLTHIIDNYHNISDYTVFTHGEYRSWHQPEPLPFVLQALNLSAVDHHGWLNLRCANQPSCTPDRSLARMGKPFSWWAKVVRALHGHIYQEHDSWYNASIPEVAGMRIPYAFGSPCCAQFVVSREAVWSKPLEFWRRAQEPLLFDTAYWAPELKTKDSNLGDSWHLGVGYERIWHYFFGKEPVTCLQEDYCRKVVYNDRIHCNRYTTDWGESRDWESIECKLGDLS